MASHCLRGQRATRPGDVAFAVTSFLLMAGYLRGFGENLRAAQSGLEDAADALFLTGLPQEESGSSETLAIVDDRRGRWCSTTSGSLTQDGRTRPGRVQSARAVR